MDEAKEVRKYWFAQSPELWFGPVLDEELRERFGALTQREHQVMEMLARGMTNREIAEKLEISIKTVDTHRAHVLKKLDLRNNSELTRFAVKHGYVTP